jgi:BirA family biotin operon repressor/biotin-[acetyl-CoA-carboxylase] ligase
MLFAECLGALAARYRDLCNGGGAAIVADWRRRAAAMFGRPVEWETTEGQQRGIADGVDETGALLVRTPAGHERVISGEVRWTS